MGVLRVVNRAGMAVGLQGLGVVDREMEGALDYSRERLQGRSLAGAKFPDKPADPIIVHADVRRMLLTQKALVEGGRALAYHAGTLVDIVEHRSEEHTYELQSLMRISYAVFCLKIKK